MDALHQLEIAWILFIQTVTAWLVDPLRTVTMLGNEEFYMLVMPMLYWCFSAGLGLRMGAMLLLSNAVNSLFKLALVSPRPYWLEGDIRAFVSEASFGLPSGHAQNAVAIWGLLASWVNSRLGRLLLAAVIILIGISRIVLGVHFISDVLLGWLIGGVLLLAFLQYEPRITRWLITLSLRQKIFAALGSSAVLAGAIIIMAGKNSGWQLPDLWIQNVLTDFSNGEIHPLDLHGAFTISGTWFGMTSGAAWLYHKKGGFNAAGHPLQRMLRYLVGIIGVIILWFGLGQVFPREADVVSYALRFFRYTLVGWWVAAAAPVLFERFGLASSRQGSPSASIVAKENPL